MQHAWSELARHMPQTGREVTHPILARRLSVICALLTDADAQMNEIPQLHGESLSIPEMGPLADLLGTPRRGLR